MGSIFCQSRFCKIFSLIRNNRNSNPCGIFRIVIAVILLCFNLYQLALDQSEFNTARTNVSLSDWILCDFFFCSFSANILWYWLTRRHQVKSCFNLCIWKSAQNYTKFVAHAINRFFLQWLTYSFNLTPLQFQGNVAFSHPNGPIISEKLTVICFHQFLSQF